MSFKKYFNLINIKEQILESIETFNPELQILLNPEERKDAAQKLVELVSRLNGTITLQPVPFIDILIMTPVQVSMVIKIAQIYQKKVDNQVIREVISSILKSFMARGISRNLLRFFPIIGVPAAFASSYIMTQAIGLSAIKAFSENQEFNVAIVKSAIDTERKKLEPVNIIINARFNAPDETVLNLPLKKRINSTDLKSVEEETKNTIIYLPNEN